MYKLIRTFTRKDTSKPWITFSRSPENLKNFTDKEIVEVVNPFKDLISSLEGLVNTTEDITDTTYKTTLEFVTEKSRDDAHNLLYNTSVPIINNILSLVQSKQRALNILPYIRTIELLP